jgi:hypothetical protein
VSFGKAFNSLLEKVNVLSSGKRENIKIGCWPFLMTYCVATEDITQGTILLHFSLFFASGIYGTDLTAKNTQL